jgi:hypothetical protein
MANHIAKALILISTVGWVGAVCVWALAGREESREISLGRNLFLTVTRHGLRGEVLVFNDPKNSPHRGLLALHMTRDWDPLPGVSVCQSSPDFGMSAVWWFTARINLLYPIGLFSVPPLIWLLRTRRRAGRGFPVGGDPRQDEGSSQVAKMGNK